MNNRRRLVVALGAGALAAPLATFAQQQTNKIYRIGFLSGGPGMEPRWEAFRQRLGELGYVDGKNTVIEWRFNQGKQERNAGFVAEIVRLKVDCIVVSGVGSTRAAKQATATIPIVMANIDADPVELGLVSSLARPGGNVTGFTGIAYELAGKRLALLKELAPKAKRAAVLVDSGGSGEAQRAHLRGTEAAARKLNMRLQVLAAGGPEELDSSAFRAAREGRAEVISVVSTGWTNSHRERIVKFAASLRLPVIYSNPFFVPIGGLMSYSANIVNQARDAAGYVAKILAGARPADLPVQQPTIFELAVNVKTAKTLGLKIPNSILVQATKVIE